MSTHSTYEALRQFADSWALIGMGVLFLVLVIWPFRAGAKHRNRDAATLIFKEDSDGE